MAAGGTRTAGTTRPARSSSTGTARPTRRGSARTTAATRPMSSTDPPGPPGPPPPGPPGPARGTRTTAATRAMSSTRSPWPTRTRAAGPRARTRSGLRVHPVRVGRQRSARSRCKSAPASAERHRQPQHRLPTPTCQGLPRMPRLPRASHTYLSVPSELEEQRHLAASPFGDALRDKSRQSRMVCSPAAADWLS